MLPADTPKLPKWPFLVGDAALLGLAWFIGDQSRNPFAGTPLIAIVVCVLCGAILAAIPFLADYARKQDEALDERQRGLESLSRTVAASAEQIGIAANGLHEIAELAQRNLKAAEQLPARLQEKISAIKIQAEAPREAKDHEKEELKKEVARLRAVDGERLQAATSQLIKAAAELSKLAAARPEPFRSSEPMPPVQVEATTPPSAPSTAEVAAIPPPISPAREETAPATEGVLPAPHEAAPAPKRARRPKPEAPAASPAPAPEAAVAPAPEISPVTTAEPEPAPIPAAAISEVVPVAPDSRAPIEFLPPAEAPEMDAAPAPDPAPTSPPAPADEVAKPERKRAPRKPRTEAPAPVTETTTVKIDSEPTLNLDAGTPNPESTTAAAAPSDQGERSVSSDGATRLLVTAYIGIGNRLFIRGSGPGLSWDKGLPLQFVSIGKWRWETNDATAPVQFKLYKNDDSECASLGAQTLDPGQQEEVTATF